jgi:hypothetical protein
MATKDLSKDITHFRYYTKRANKYFFTAWINGVFAHITLKRDSNGSEIEYSCEPTKEVVTTEEQDELILESCIKELRDRKFIV